MISCRFGNSLSSLTMLLLLARAGSHAPFQAAGRDGVTEARDLVEMLASSDSAMSQHASREIFERGDGMIPALLACRGDRRLYVGGGLGHRLAAQLVVSDPAASTERHVPVEVACLYLLEAIFRGRLDFAQSPYLRDSSVPEDARRACNSEELVTKAWIAVEGWQARLERATVTKLRERGMSPLSGGKVAFW